LKLPRCSGIVTANTASRASPSSARSATKRRRSKFMLAPQATVTSVSFFTGSLGQLRALDIGLGAGHGQRAGRLQDAARVLEHILDRGADGVGVDDDDLVHVLLREAEGFLAHQRTAVPSENRPTSAG
jgi:hypothetical protein